MKEKLGKSVHSVDPFIEHFVNQLELNLSMPRLMIDILKAQVINLVRSVNPKLAYVNKAI